MPRKPRSAVVSRTKAGTYHICTRVTRGMLLLAREHCPWAPAPQRDFTGGCAGGADSGPADPNDPDDLGGAPLTMKSLFLARLDALRTAFPMALLSYAIMDNHLHLVIHFDPAEVKRWSDRDVVERWVRLCPGDLKRRVDPEAAILRRIDALCGQKRAVKKIRGDLRNLSVFTKLLKQAMAEHYNRQTRETGSLFQGRCAISRAGSDLEAVAMLAYVECNPYAAGLCEKPERGLHTSLEARLWPKGGAASDQQAEDAQPERVRRGLRVLCVLPEKPVVLERAGCCDAEGRFKLPPLHERLTLKTLRSAVSALAAKLRPGKRCLEVSAKERWELAQSAAQAVWQTGNPALA